MIARSSCHMIRIRGTKPTIDAARCSTSVTSEPCGCASICCLIVVMNWSQVQGSAGSETGSYHSGANETLSACSKEKKARTLYVGGGSVAGGARQIVSFVGSLVVVVTVVGVVIDCVMVV
jgi:hypothetical protein